MSCRSTWVDAPPQTVFDVLADPPRCEIRVVGTKGIRGHDRLKGLAEVRAGVVHR